MDSVTQVLSVVGGQRAVMVLGGIYVVLGVSWPFVEVATGAPVIVGVILGVLVGGSGLVLVLGGYRLSQTEIHPECFSIVARWCLRSIGIVIGILLFIEVLGGLAGIVPSGLIFTSLGAVAGFGAGKHEAQAKSRTYVLEQRNEELQETQAELEETVAQLELSEQRYRTVTENFPNGAVALIDTELRHKLIAGKGFENVGYDASDFQDEYVHEAYSERMVEEIEPHYRATLAGESTTFTVDIHGRIFEFRTHPLTNDADEVYALIAMSQDVTGRTQREQELEKRASQQQAIADLGQFALETDDLDELLEEAAQCVVDVLEIECCKVLDRHAEGEDLLLRHGVGWDDGLVGTATVSATEDASPAAYTLATDHPVVTEDLRKETRFEGSALLARHEIRSGISTVIGPFTEPWGILGAHDTAPQTFTDEDVMFVQSVANIIAEAIERYQYQSELEQLVAGLEASNTRLEQFAYAASHDLQEPLRMVSSYLQLLNSRYEDKFDEDGQEFLEFAVAGADRMRSMIESLLQYSRIETRGDPFEPVELETVINEVREDLGVRIDENNATITTEPLPTVEGDATQLRQVFQNLLDNAIAYSGEDPPTIHISAQRNGTDWIISVHDDGIGIKPEFHDRIFEVFQRLHTNAEYSGTGIGLALCERIIERHGGEIWVESEPGNGATFSVSLSSAGTQDELRPYD